MFFDDLVSEDRLQTPVKLSDLEVDIARRVGTKRFEYCREKGHKYEPADGKMDPLYREHQSFASEMAYCKLSGLAPDFSYDLFESYDVRTLFDAHIEIKWTRWVNGNLLVRVTQKVINDPPFCFALVVGEIPDFLYCGYIMAHEMMVEGRKTQELHVNGRTIPLTFPNWKATQNELLHRIMVW